MATLTNGETATLSLDAFASVAVTATSQCQGTMTWTSAMPSRIPSFTSRIQNKTYGPHGAPMTLVIAVTAGSLTYTIENETGGYVYDASSNIIGLVGGSGATLKIPRLIAEKTAVTDGAVQTADQVIGSLSIPAGSLNVGDVFRVLATIGRQNGTDVYGSATGFRMGTAGTVADTSLASSNLSSLFTGGGTALSIGIEKWFRVVSIGTNSVIEVLGVGNGASSWNAISVSSAAVATQVTLTGYNLTTQAGFCTVTTTMGAATTTTPRTGYCRLEIQV